MKPTPRFQRALDLGCGTAKPPGFFGLDRLTMPGVDVIANLDQPLPFADNTFELVYASHSLEHVSDLTRTMQEIFRVCRDRAQVCVVAPYYSQGINFANPYHRQGFNEHTPRFWTPSAETGMPAAEYEHPHARPWGLSQSDQSDPGIDFRCMQMEFFYFPHYRELPVAEQRAARKKYLDVCDQIVYHLLVVKQPISESEMKQHMENTELYDPPLVAQRRLQERLEALETSLGRAQGLLAASRADLAQARDTLSKREAELSHAQSALSAREADLAQAQQQLSARDADLQGMSARSRALAGELESFRNGRIINVLNRFTDRSDARDEISSAFQQLKDDSLTFTRGLGSYRLQVGRNLQRATHVQYPVEPRRAQWSGVLLAPVLDFPAMAGAIGVEIVSAANVIVAHVTQPLSGLDGTAPCAFTFEPLAESGRGRFWLRVFVRESDVPVRMFEWRRYVAWGLGPLQTRAFCGFVFGP